MPKDVVEKLKNENLSKTKKEETIKEMKYVQEKYKSIFKILREIPTTLKKVEEKVKLMRNN